MNEFFTDKELACKGTGTLRLHPGFREKLNALRAICGFPFIVNSCCRDPAYNTRIGGHPHSLHLTVDPHHPTLGSMAVDVSTAKLTDAQQQTLLKEAWKAGWSVGINEKQKFYHLDRRVDINLPQQRFDYD